VKEMGISSAAADSPAMTPATLPNMVRFPQSVTLHASRSHAKPPPPSSGPVMLIMCGAMSRTQGIEVNTRQRIMTREEKANVDTHKLTLGRKHYFSVRKKKGGGWGWG
jgi:hypothetical protein